MKKILLTSILPSILCSTALQAQIETQRWLLLDSTETSDANGKRNKAVYNRDETGLLQSITGKAYWKNWYNDYDWRNVYVRWFDYEYDYEYDWIVPKSSFMVELPLYSEWIYITTEYEWYYRTDRNFFKSKKYWQGSYVNFLRAEYDSYYEIENDLWYEYTCGNNKCGSSATSKITKTTYKNGEYYCKEQVNFTEPLEKYGIYIQENDILYPVELYDDSPYKYENDISELIVDYELISSDKNGAVCYSTNRTTTRGGENILTYTHYYYSYHEVKPFEAKEEPTTNHYYNQKIYYNERTGVVDIEFESEVKVYDLQGNLLQTIFGKQVNLPPYEVRVLNINGEWYVFGLKTSIKEVKSESITIYPNPTTDIVYIDSESEIKVYSSQGALLQTIFGKQVDLSAYPAGIYFLNIQGKLNKVVKK